ncbi:MAG: hypothetical protein GEV11_25500 [Streptosporangiales bacterium]|nr:hypothetical protein [Streptosporangiales bacterium]
MESPSSTLGVGLRRKAALLAAPTVIALVMALIMPSASAAPASSGRPAVAPPPPAVSIDELNRKAAQLAKEYRGELVVLTEARKAAYIAALRARKLQRAVKQVRREISALASMRYQGADLDPGLILVMSGDPEGSLDSATTMEYVSRTKAQRIDYLRRLVTEEREAVTTANRKLEKAQEIVDTLENRRAVIRRKIAIYGGNGPVNAGSITPLMRKVMNATLARYGPGKGVGCFRSNGGIPGGGEHPLGRACDFMLSTGGAMPDSDQVQRGHEIAEWQRANAESLGILYIIYRQRIWDSRTGGGWSYMEDRGGITANHMDHVHTSVF